MQLTTKRLILKKVSLKDLPGYFAMSSQPEVPVYAGFPTPRTAADTRKRLRAWIADWGKGRWASRQYSVFLKSDGTWIGGATLRWPHQGLGELGYALHPDHWGKGYATEAVERLIQLAFKDFGAHRVQATTWVKNTRSTRVLKKAGLRREGLLRGYLKREGKVRDELMYALTRPDWLRR